MPGRRTRAAAATATTLAALALPVLAGCSGGSPTGAATTRTPSGSPTGRDTAAALRSSVLGRTWDVGTITAIEHVGTTQVVVLDRWTVKGLSDAKLASDGIPVKRYAFDKSPYTNENTKVTFRIPVTADPLVILRHCISADLPLQAKSATLADLAAAGEKDRIVLVGLDPRGWLVSAQNLPGC